MITAHTKLGRYEVRAKIGEGGMGEVYLADDTRLHRKVALKVLPAHLAMDTDRMRRFEQEALAAASLNHPNIAHIYEIDEHEGTKFIAMEFVDGETLRDKLRHGKSPLKDLLRSLMQVAEGLAKAHVAGIIHRDLKPDNIIISTDGHAKILDFGVAKLVETASQIASDSQLSELATAMMPAQHSTPGLVIGTVGYMSPEQAQAKPVDQRSDIFSFGCLLYEVATGQKPFAGESVVDTLHKIIHDPAPAITDFSPTALPELQRIIRKCLAKEPEKRYQTIRDTANDLEELIDAMKGVRDLDRSVASANRSGAGFVTDVDLGQSTQATTAPPQSSAEYLVTGLKRHKLLFGAAMVVMALTAVSVALLMRTKGNEPIDSIAVLPFENKSNDADFDYLSDGLAESLIYRLSQLPNLKVSPTTSVIRYKGKPTDVKTIANELGVRAVMTGRMVKHGDDFTISVELVDARNNKVVWGEQYDRKRADLMITQREMATTITQKLQLKLAGNEARGITKHYTDNNEAYQLYLNGRFHFARRTEQDLRRSIELFDEAIKLDPNYALAYQAKGESYAVLPSYPYMSPQEALPQARAAIAKALELDPDLPEAHTSYGVILAVYDWNWTEAEREFKRAIELDPNLAISHYRYAWTYLSPMGRHDEAIAEMKRAMELEPLSLIQNANFAAVYLYARNYDLALQQAQKTYDLDVSFVGGQMWLAHGYNMRAQYPQALAIADKWDDSDVPFYADAAYAYAKMGRRAEAEAVLNKWKAREKTRYVSNYWLAVGYGALGEKDEAFAELEKAYQAHDWFLQRLKVDPFMDSLRGDPRFNDLVKRIGLPT